MCALGEIDAPLPAARRCAQAALADLAHSPSSGEAPTHLLSLYFRKQDPWDQDISSPLSVFRTPIATGSKKSENHSSYTQLIREFDLLAAIPLFFLNSALNIGVAAGTIMPWGSGLWNSPTPLPDRFHMGGGSSSLCLLCGPTSLFGLGFKRKWLGPPDVRRLLPIKAEGGSDFPVTSGRDTLGADIGVTAFADLSLDLPPKVLGDYGIHGCLYSCWEYDEINGRIFQRFFSQAIYSQL